MFQWVSYCTTEMTSFAFRGNSGADQRNGGDYCFERSNRRVSTNFSNQSRKSERETSRVFTSLRIYAMNDL